MLATVEDAVRVAVADEANEIRREAERRAAAIIAAARADAAALIATRRAAAERLAEREEGERIADARAHARSVVLRAQRAVIDDARAATHLAARRLLDDPAYARRLGCLEADARRRLADHPPVKIVAGADGGFVAQAGDRAIDCSLGAQVERVLAAKAPQLAALWA